MEKNPAYTSLIEMGFSEFLVRAAIRNLKTQQVGSLTDWIDSHGQQQQKWKQWLEQNKEEQVSLEKVQQAQSISVLVNQQLAQQLQKKGHSKNVSEKSLLFTSNVSIQSAEKWIEDHRYDPDFEQELMLEGKAYQQSTLTEQQAKQKLKQLTQKARLKRKQRQEEQERQRQKNRLKYGKQMTQAKRIADQLAMKRKVQLDKIQKRRDQQYKKNLLQQMRRQRQQKLGLKPTQNRQSNTGKKVQQKPKLSKTEQLQVQCQQVKVGMHAYPDRAKSFFQTAGIYVNNIIKNNGEQKFRKIKKENNAFKARVGQCFGGIETIQVIGYQDDGQFYVMRNWDIKQLQQIAQLLERYKSYY